MKFTFLLPLLLLGKLVFAQASSREPLFQNHQDGYNLFRIPTIIKAKSGKLLAFCEGRKSIMDHGDIDLVMKSSDDEGQTWSKLTVVWNDAKNTCGNPCPVVEQLSGDIIVVGTLNNDKVFVLRSVDEGQSWETPLDITQAVKPQHWKWYASGPGHAIQMQHNSFQQRLVVPCNHTENDKKGHISHLIYSDDGGNTWLLGASVAQVDTDECTVVELSNGQLQLNMRNARKGEPYRKTSLSTDGGLHWSIPQLNYGLLEPTCQGALLRYALEPNLLLFVNPKHARKRKNLSLSISTDDGQTWNKHIVLWKRKSAYSDIVVLDNGDVLCIFEAGKLWPYGGIFSIVLTKSAMLEALKD